MDDVDKIAAKFRVGIDLTRYGSPGSGSIKMTWEEVLAVLDDRDRLKAERDTLNEIIGMCAAALPNGAFILPEASLDLKRKLPKEITLCVEKAYAHAQANDSRE